MGLMDEVNSQDRRRGEYEARQAAELNRLVEALDANAREFAAEASRLGIPSERFPGADRPGWKIDIDYDDWANTQIAILDDGTWQLFGYVDLRENRASRWLLGSKDVTGVVGTRGVESLMVPADVVRERFAAGLVRLRDANPS